MTNSADADAEISDQFGYDRRRDDVPWREIWGVPLMRSQCGDGIPPRTKSVH